MRELLLAESTRERLSAELEQLADIVCVCPNAQGEFVRGTDIVPAEELSISMVRLDLELFSAHQEKIIGLILSTPSMDFVQTAVAGLDNPMFKKIVEKTDVFCSSDAQSPAISEFVVASVLNRWHRFDLRREYQAQGNWQENEFKQIFGSRWLIVGFGNIGEGVARQVKACGAKVTGIRRNLAPNEHADAMLSLDDLHARLPQADVVVLSCALNDATRDMASTAFFEAMKPDAILVNIGRGELLDEDALITALDENQLDYAALDVFRTEPLQEESPLWSHSRVQMTPHASHRGSATSQRFDDLFLANLHGYLAGGEVRLQVRKDYFA